MPRIFNIVSSANIVFHLGQLSVRVPVQDYYFFLYSKYLLTLYYVERNTKNSLAIKARHKKLYSSQHENLPFEPLLGIKIVM